MEQGVCIGPHGSEALTGAQLLHAGVYEALGFVVGGQQRDCIGRIVDSWSPTSTHFGLVEDGNAVGHLRLVNRPNETGLLPCEVYSGGSLELPPDCAEISSLVIDGEHGLHFRSARELYKAAFWCSYQRGDTHWAAIVEEPLHRVLTRVFKFPFSVCGDKIEYGKTSNLPLLLSLKDAVENKDKMHPFFTQ